MNKIVHISAQKRAFAEAETGHRVSKQMRGVNFYEIEVSLRVVSHTRDQTDAQTEPNVGLDDIRIDSGKRELGHQATILERLVPALSDL